MKLAGNWLWWVYLHNGYQQKLQTSTFSSCSLKQVYSHTLLSPYLCYGLESLASLINNNWLETRREIQVRLCWGPCCTFHFPALEKEMATHSNVLAWRIPGTVEPGGLPSMGSHRVRHDWSDLAAAAAAAVSKGARTNSFPCSLRWGELVPYVVGWG